MKGMLEMFLFPADSADVRRCFSKSTREIMGNFYFPQIVPMFADTFLC